MKTGLAMYLAKSMRWLLGIGVAATIGVQATFAYNFWNWQWTWPLITFSADPANWGQYGDYIGGLLNPIFSSLAFSALVITIVLQGRQIESSEKQLEHNKAQAHREELQRLLSSVSAGIDRALNSYPTFYKAKAFIEDVAPLTVFTHIQAFGTQILRPDLDVSFQEGLAQDRFAAVREDLDMTLRALGFEFMGLAGVMKKYQASDGSTDIFEFYFHRYLAVVCWMDAMGGLGAHAMVHEVFRIAEYRKIFES